MTAKEMWNEYRIINKEANDYEAWSFATSEGDSLARLVLDGIKTATSSLYERYKKDDTMFPQLEAYKLSQQDIDYNEPNLPKINAYNVILNGNGEAVCITRTTKVIVIPFNKVDSLHAEKEGDGERTLEYWQKVHEAFFREETTLMGIEFTEEMLILCEEFELVYPKDAQSVH